MRHPQAFKFQVNGEERLISVKPIPGSPCRVVQEFYRCADAPSGYYLTGAPDYIEGDPQDAACEFVRRHIGDSR